MKYAVIDLGSNTIHLAVFTVNGNDITKVFSEKKTAGLAGYVSDGVLSNDGMMKACETVNGLKAIALGMVDPSNLYLFATASLRNIKNREQAVSVIKKKTSLKPDILNGDEEARMGFLGASAECSEGVMTDIGGASTEIVIFRNGKIKNTASLPVGSLSMYTNHVRGDIPTAEEMDNIRQTVDAHLSQIGWADGISFEYMVCIGGTARAMQKLFGPLLDIREEGGVGAGNVKDIIKLLKSGDDDIYRTVYRTVPERMLTILPGLIIMKQIIKKFGCGTISVSRSGVRDGYVMTKVLNTDG